MTNSRLAYNGLRATLAVALTAGATTITFSSALKHAGGTNVPTLAGGDYIPLAIVDPASGALTEIVKLTAYTAAGTTGTIARAQEGTPGIAHAVGDIVIRAPLASDSDTVVYTPTVAGTCGAPTGPWAAMKIYRTGRLCTLIGAQKYIASAGTGGAAAAILSAMPAAVLPIAQVGGAAFYAGTAGAANALLTTAGALTTYGPAFPINTDIGCSLSWVTNY